MTGTQVEPELMDIAYLLLVLRLLPELVEVTMAQNKEQELFQGQE